MPFSNTDKLKSLAIVRIFETSTPFGDYAAVAVLDDGAGVSYGINQFTHRSGALGAVVEKYLANGGAIGRNILQDRLITLKRTESGSVLSLANDEVFKKALKAAAASREMRAAQNKIAFERFLKPALNVCEAFGFENAVSLTVIYDSLTHGSWVKIRDRVGVQEPRDERNWITDYVIARHRWLGSIPRLAATRYRTRFFLEEIARGNWDLALPLMVNGHRLDARAFEEAAEDHLSSAAQDPAAGEHPTSSDVSSSTTPADRSATPPIQEGSLIAPVATARGTDLQPHSSRPPDMKHEAAEVSTGELRSGLEKVAEVYGRVEQIAETALTRSDRAKSLWTTVAGTLWQTAWAVIGFVTHMPRVFWLAAAVAVAVLTALYLYRQIVLGRIRETQTGAQASRLHSSPPAG